MSTTDDNDATPSDELRLHWALNGGSDRMALVALAAAQNTANLLTAITTADGALSLSVKDSEALTARARVALGLSAKPW